MSEKWAVEWYILILYLYKYRNRVINIYRYFQAFGRLRRNKPPIKQVSASECSIDKKNENLSHSLPRRQLFLSVNSFDSNLMLFFSLLFPSCANLWMILDGLFICRIVNESTKEAAAVDPVEPEKVLEASNSYGLTLKFVLTTHHHWLLSLSL